MFGLEILDVVIGLMFVYLLLSLLATAINEYISAVLNLRGRELARGLGRLLDDLDEQDAVQNALDGVGKKLTTRTARLTEQFYNHHLIRPYATRRGRFGRFVSWIRGEKEKPRLPSYIPARTFALALLDLLGVQDKDFKIDSIFPIPSGKTLAEAVADAENAAVAAAAHANALAAAEQGANTPEALAAAKKAADEKAAAQAAADEAAKEAQAARDRAAQDPTPEAAAAAEDARQRAAAANELAQSAGTLQRAMQEAAEARRIATRGTLAHVLTILDKQSAVDLREHLTILGGLPQADKLAANLQLQVAGLLAGAQTQLQKLHDGVEIWFNNSMDRVSGAYKRTVQGWLFVIGFVLAGCFNADSIDMWRRLAENDKLRDAMAARAISSVGALDSVVNLHARQVENDSTPPTGSGQAGTEPTEPGGTGERANDSIPAGTGSVPADSGSILTGTDLIPASSDTIPNGTDSIPAPADSITARVEAARTRYRAARARLDSMELKLGWTRPNLIQIGVLDTMKAKRDSLGRIAKARSTGDSAVIAQAREHQWWYGVSARAPFTHSQQFFAKVLGLLLTAIAISLGAPFWFDLLNKVISIRAAGRSPAEEPKSPKGPPKRAGEQSPA